MIGALRRNGFTLLETVIVIALFLVITLALTNFFLSYNNSYVYDSALIDTASSAGTVQSDVMEYGLASDRVMANYTFGSVSYTSSANTLVLEVPSIDASGNVIANAFDYVAFYRSGQSIYHVVLPAANSSRHAETKLLSSSALSLAFTYDTADVTNATRVTIDLITQDTVKGRAVQTHLTNAVYLRNHSS